MHTRGHSVDGTGRTAESRAALLFWARRPRRAGRRRGSKVVQPGRIRPCGELVRGPGSVRPPIFCVILWLKDFNAHSRAQGKVFPVVRSVCSCVEGRKSLISPNICKSSRELPTGARIWHETGQKDNKRFRPKLHLLRFRLHVAFDKRFERSVLLELTLQCHRVL